MNLNYTLFGQMVAFLAFVAFCAKFIWPLIIHAMEERQQKIADGLAAAERAGRDLELAQERSTEAMRNAKKEAASLLDATNKRAAQIIDEAKDQARAEAERIITAAQSEVDQQVKRAKEKLRSEVAYLALAGAEKVLEASVDETTHRAMIDKLAANL